MKKTQQMKPKRTPLVFIHSFEPAQKDSIFWCFLPIASWKKLYVYSEMQIFNYNVGPLNIQVIMIF